MPLRIVTLSRLADRRSPRTRLTGAESLVTAYKRERQRQKILIRKAKLCDAKLVFVLTAFSKLLTDDNFVTLLRAETLTAMPKCLWEKAAAKMKEAA